MLRITPIRTPERASDHLARVHRYGGDASPVTAWFGAGAAAKGLSGPIDGAQLETLLDGRINEWTRLGRRRGGERDHRPGWELMFSAPKSVSLAALVGGDQTLLMAHDAATREALTWLEVQAAATRLSSGGKRHVLPTGCLLAAIVRHEVSRAAEPHLHSRVLVVNATLAASGTWRTLYSLPLYVGARQAGIRYQQALAGYAGSLGYDIAWRANDTCELDAVPRELRSLFSSRTKALEQRLARRGLDRRTASGKQREHATRQAESVRAPLPGKQQRRHDGTLAQQAGFDLEAFVARTRQAGQRTLTHSPSIDGSTVNDPSAPLSSTRVEGL